MATTNDISAKEQADIDRDRSLKAKLFMLQTILNAATEEVDRSYALIEVGEKTDLSKHLEKSIDNPLIPLLDSAQLFKNNIKASVDSLVKSFLLTKSDFLLKAFKTKTDFNDLHYSIVLQKDSRESRDEIFQFYEIYDELSFSEHIAPYNLADNFPVYFLFVPEHLIDQVNLAEQIIPEVK